MSITSGPWIASYLYSCIATSKEWILESRKTICDINESCPEWKANMQAISAVPEMMEVVDIVDGGMWRESDGKWICEFTDEEVNKIHLAKAKAKVEGDES